MKYQPFNKSRKIDAFEPWSNLDMERIRGKMKHAS